MELHSHEHGQKGRDGSYEQKSSTGLKLTSTSFSHRTICLSLYSSLFVGLHLSVFLSVLFPSHALERTDGRRDGHMGQSIGGYGFCSVARVMESVPEGYRLYREIESIPEGYRFYREIESIPGGDGFYRGDRVYTRRGWVL